MLELFTRYLSHVCLLEKNKKLLRPLVYPSRVDKTAYIYYNMHTDLSREVFMNKKDEKIKL